jgi:hypothetical protein
MTGAEQGAYKGARSSFVAHMRTYEILGKVWITKMSTDVFSSSFANISFVLRFEKKAICGNLILG